MSKPIEPACRGVHAAMNLLPEFPPEEKPRISRRALLLFAAGGFIGTVFGVLLAIVTIILPWKVLQNRERQGSGFLQTFDPVGMVRKIGPTEVTWTSSEEILKRHDLGDREERVWARLIQISGKGIKPSDQAALVKQFSSLIRADPTSWYYGPPIEPQSFRETLVPNESRFFGDSVIGYRSGEVEGFVRIWSVGHDDEIELLMTIQER